MEVTWEVSVLSVTRKDRIEREEGRLKEGRQRKGRRMSLIDSKKDKKER